METSGLVAETVVETSGLVAEKAVETSGLVAEKVVECDVDSCCLQTYPIKTKFVRKLIAIFSANRLSFSTTFSANRAGVSTNFSASFCL